MKIDVWILSFVYILVLAACGPGKLQDGKSAGSIPDFKIAEIVNTSTAKQRSFTVKISLPLHYPESSVRSALPTISNTLNEPESEITMLFYGPSASLHGPYDVARAIWKDNRLDEIDYKPESASQRKP